ncbi:MAG: hypothetical protein ACTSWY_08845 [Promethearchaeota archaeon]
MKKTKVRYKISPSDSDDWVIIELIDRKIKLDLKKEVLTFRYDCNPHFIVIEGKKLPCSNFCCYSGCYISPLEIKFIEKILPELKKNYLEKDSLEILLRDNDEFYLPEDYDEDEDLYKIKCAPVDVSFRNDIDDEEDEDEDEDNEEDEEDEEEKGDNIDSYESSIQDIPETHCLFLMENGLCSIHKFCTDEGLDWTINKMNICTTFPMDIRVTNNETSADAIYPEERRVEDECSTLKMMDDFESFLYTKMDCINLSHKTKKKKGIPYIIDSMKYAIVSRFGEDMWSAINDYANKFRKQ